MDALGLISSHVSLYFMKEWNISVFGLLDHIIWDVVFWCILRPLPGQPGSEQSPSSQHDNENMLRICMISRLKRYVSDTWSHKRQLNNSVDSFTMKCEARVLLTEYGVSGRLVSHNSTLQQHSDKWPWCALVVCTGAGGSFVLKACTALHWTSMRCNQFNSHSMVWWVYLQQYLRSAGWLADGLSTNIWRLAWLATAWLG